MLKTLLVSGMMVLAALNSGKALAEDGHELSSIKGDLAIDLKVYDHAMAGSVKNFVIWGSVNEAQGTSELIMRRDGQDVKTLFRQTEKQFGGTVEHRGLNGTRTTNIQFAGLDRQKNEYTFLVNGENVKAVVTSEDFRNNHFIKPTYTISGRGIEGFSFKFEGQACYKYSLHMITMMIAAATH